MPATIFYVGALVIAGFLGIYLASRLGLGENMYTRMLVESASYSLSFVIWGLVAAGGAAYTKLVWGTLSGRGDA